MRQADRIRQGSVGNDLKVQIQNEFSNAHGSENTQAPGNFELFRRWIASSSDFHELWNVQLGVPECGLRDEVSGRLCQDGVDRGRENIIQRLSSDMSFGNYPLAIS